MAKLQTSCCLKLMQQIHTSPYVANNVLNLIDTLEKKQDDYQLELITRILKENILLESSDRTPLFHKIEIVKGCIYNLDTYLVTNYNDMGI